MGCCIQNRDDPNNKEKSNVMVDIKGNLTNKLFTKYTNTNNQTNKMDNVKNYFKSGNNNSASNINIISNLNNNKQAQNNHSNNMENTFGNSITMENSNINIGNSMNNNIQGLFKTTNKGSSNIITPISIHTNVSTNILNQEREKKEKENAEQNEKLKASNIEMKADNPNKNAQDNEKYIKFPRIEFQITNSKNPDEKSLCVITPNSINDEVKMLGEKFYFGKDDPRYAKKNHYNLNDDSIGVRQFEIAYNQEKGKFFLVDNKRGTGLFIKIKQKIYVDHDMIISFCASHMILQLEGENEKKTKSIKIRFLQGPHQNQEWSFNPSDKKIIRIGRSKSAEIVYKDDSISRIQCTLVFENNDWYLYDGYLDNGNKGSTNGLWLLASSKVEVTDDMTLKTGNTTIKVRLFEN